MKTPVRWLDDPTLDADLRADLECVQAHPWQPDMARAAASLDAALSAQPSPGDALSELASHGAVPAAVGSSAPALLSTKLVVVVLSGSLLVATGFWQLQPKAPTQTAPATLQPSTAGSVADVRHQVVAQPAQPASASRLEIEQLRRIYAALDRDPAHAYRLARASLEQLPRGTLREEREGLAVIALWLSGDHPAARIVAAQFIARYPESPLCPRIRKLLASEPNP